MLEDKNGSAVTIHTSAISIHTSAVSFHIVKKKKKKLTRRILVCNSKKFCTIRFASSDPFSVGWVRLISRFVSFISLAWES